MLKDEDAIMDKIWVYTFGSFILLLNITTFLLFGIDKRKSLRQQWRIKESKLLFFAFLAPVGALCGMKFFHHKTQKLKFSFFVPFFLLLHIAFLIFLLWFRSMS